MATNNDSFPKSFLEAVAAADPNFDKKDLDSKLQGITDIERVNVIYDIVVKYDLFLEYEECTKDDNLAVEFKISGNKSYGKGNYLEALDDYTVSLALAKSDKVIALCYANRSACFYRLGMRKQCLQDIDRAFASKYPKAFYYKLIDRREKAKKLQESTDCYEATPEIPLLRKNVLIQCASDSVRIKNRKKRFERYIVATKNIEIGEVIAVERPYACATTITANHLNFKYCYLCLELCYNPIPCNCTRAMFCSEQCREKAQDSYHKVECPILFMLESFSTHNPMVLLALRTAFLGVNQFREALSFAPGDTKYYRSDRYNEVELLPPKAQCSFLRFLNDAILSAFIFELVRTKTTYFSTICDSGNEEIIKNKFKELLIQQLLTIKQIACKIGEYNIKSHETDSFGFGLYSFSSLFKHSCCANVTKSFYGNALVLRASNTIKAGQRCYVDRYELQYDTHSKSVREKKLPLCACIPCTENWTPSSGDFSYICGVLGIDSMEVGDIVKNVIGSDINAANRHLPRLLSLLKKCEDSEPCGNAVILKKIIAHCYQIFGNKRTL